MEMLLNVALIILISEAWGVDIEKSFREGKDVNLTCGDKTWTENIFYIIWKLHLKDENCEIGSNRTEQRNTCWGDKTLSNDNDQPILHIPHISVSDAGNYTCECVYLGGSVNNIYHITVTAPPKVTMWTDTRGNKTLVRCSVDSPTANISWSPTDLLKTVQEPDRPNSVQSSVEVSVHEQPLNVSCIVTDPYWNQPQVFTTTVFLDTTTSQNHLVLPVTVAVSVVFSLALLLWGIIKLHNLRSRQLSLSKSSRDEYVEEVEPYESYVQRVNSIYNSSRDLFP